MLFSSHLRALFVFVFALIVGPSSVTAFQEGSFSLELEPPQQETPAEVVEREVQMPQPVTDSAETADMASVTEAHVEEGAKKTLSKFKEAMAGDPQAAQDLVVGFFVPAIVVLGVLMLGYFVASFIGGIIGGQVSKRIDLTLGRFLGKITKNIIVAFVLVGVLNHFGVDVTSFAAIIAAFGFAIGMALQGTLGNFAAGVMLMVFRPFKIGDYIHVSDCEGEVEEIDLFTTKLNTLDNRHLIVPNGQIFGSTITSFTKNQHRRVDVNVGVDYNANVDRTRAVLQASIGQIPGAVNDPPPQVVMSELGDSSVDWQVRVWCEPADYWEVRELLTVAAKKGLDLNGIGIPFPQLELHLPSAVTMSKKAA